MVTLFRIILFNNEFFLIYDYYVKHYIMIYVSALLGPLTYTSDGETTIYGVVSGQGVFDYKGYCVSPTRYFRVNTPDALIWIKTFVKN